MLHEAPLGSATGGADHARESRRRSDAGTGRVWAILRRLATASIMPLMAVWLSIEGAAARSGFSKKTLYRAIAAGELKAAKVRCRWRIAVQDLEAWLLPSPMVGRPVALRVGVEPEAGSLAALRLIEKGHR